MSLQHHRRYPSTAIAGEVLAELLARPCPFVLVVRPSGTAEPYYYVFPVDARLFERLSEWPAATLKDALDLHESTAESCLAVSPGGPRGRPRGVGGGPSVLVNDAGRVLGLDKDTGVTRQALYPDMEASQSTVVPGDTIDVTVQLLDRVPALDIEPIEIEFQPGQQSYLLMATVTNTRGFDCPAGESWLRCFEVRRSPGGPVVTPPPWTFRARATPGPKHELTVVFLAGAAACGHVTLEVADATLAGAEQASSVSAAPVRVRAPREGSTLLLRKTADDHQVLLFEDGVCVEEPLPWPGLDSTFLDITCGQLQQAGDIDAVREVGRVIWNQLPPALRSWLAKTRPSTAPLTILSDQPLLPFEVTALCDVGGSPILGAERPVVRWVPEAAEMETHTLDVTSAACIRPEYDPPVEPAREEEKRLRARIDRTEHVGTADGLRGLLRGRADIPLLHYAGHAQGAPSAGLQFGPGKPFAPHEFSGALLLARAHPFVFINGCQAGFATSDTLAAYANFPWTLLVAHASGVIASLLELAQEAAPVAADTFYDAVFSGATVGEALRRVRALALTTSSPAHARSFMSYLAYGAPDLTMRRAPATR